jgi:uroporphyrinogen-III synthase
LITRPEPMASETAARVAAMGFTPIVASLLEIRPTPVSLPPRERIAAVLLTSGNAVVPALAPLRTTPTLTVGGATASRASAAGFETVVSADGDAVALASLVRARLRPTDGTLLLAAGRGQSMALAGELRASGYHVARRVVYAAMPVAELPPAARAALLDSRTRAVLFFSAETARQFVRLVRAAGLAYAVKNREAITIGPRAGMALKEVAWSRIRVAREPNQHEMLALLL